MRLAFKKDGNITAEDQEIVFNILDVNDERRLRVATGAARARYEDGQWLLEDLVQSRISEQGVTRRAVASAAWRSRFEPDLVNVVSIKPESLSIPGLRRYVAYLDGNGLDTSRFELALWSKFAYPLATGVMIVLAVPMVLGRLKMAGVGQRILIGVLVGIGFHVLNQASGHLGLVYGLSPFASATAPTLMFAAAAAWMLRRVG